jgi:hypothetical protein
MDEKVIDRMLELCYISVEKMAAEIDDHAKELNEHGILQEPPKVNKFFHTLGAAAGNFLMTFAEVTNQDELIDAFKHGLESFIEYCHRNQPGNGGPPIKDRPGSLRVLSWYIDNPKYLN